MNNRFRTEKAKSLHSISSEIVGFAASGWTPRIGSFNRRLDRFMEQTPINNKLPQGLNRASTFRGSKPLDTSVRRQQSEALASTLFVSYFFKQNAGPEEPTGQLLCSIAEVWRKEGAQQGCDTIESNL